ncbi:hypothetical protein QJS10_CPB04g01130 [Acorus calamus]|uniref:Uncharacterized protein n=1 Tax=Acorus calamus TaxID=4465 RepID=A0AAV9F1P7_ACOCL|nr:hypothetical protein QJS10_CPB04g01130 [Acorus calamus]
MVETKAQILWAAADTMRNNSLETSQLPQQEPPLPPPPPPEESSAVVEARAEGKSVVVDENDYTTAGHWNEFPRFWKEWRRHQQWWK